MGPSSHSFPCASPTADASLLPVCAISGHGISMSSRGSSGCSELTQKTQLLTTGDPQGHARTCLPPPSARELNVFLRRISQQHSSASPPAAASCCPEGFNRTQDSFPLPVLGHCQALVTHQLWPSCHIPHQRWLRAPGVGADSPLCLSPWRIKSLGSLFWKQVYKCQILLTVQVRGGNAKELVRLKN